MNYLNVVDKSLYDKLTKSGWKLEKTQKDINGLTIWTLSSDGYVFDIENIEFKGKCCYAEPPKKIFNKV